jgi:Neuraminidase (sialidase)
MKHFITFATIFLFTLPAMAAEKKPAPPGVVSLDVYADGARIDLLTGTRDVDSPAALRFQRSDDGGKSWTTPVPVGAGQPAPEPVHRGMDAQIAAAGDRLVAIWTTGADTRMGRGPLASALSADGGKTWSAGPSPSDDGKVIDHAFVDIAADAAGTFHAVWLDAREGRHGKGLRYARSTDGGQTWSKNLTLDPETCECCWNKIAVGRDGNVYVLFRQANPRDMAVVASHDGGKTWGKPVTAGAFGWDINACPHVGGGLAINGDKLFAAVWTARGHGANGAFIVASHDAGRSFGPPVQLGNPQSWHPDLATAGGMLVATWDAYTDAGPAVFEATSHDDGKTWSAPAQLSAFGVTASVPRAVATNGGFRIFWTEKSPDAPAMWTSKKILR